MRHLAQVPENTHFEIRQHKVGEFIVKYNNFTFDS